ncbi:MAG: Fur family transcriptional regulator [Candidatus Aminicenantes bacterium]|nr:Fur family transcriptional regulator [Candidatus Aminicenantes bacterium]
MERQNAMAKKLKAAGLKLTPQRLAIVRVLAASAEHPSVDDLCARLRKDFPGISPATVYRNVTLIKSLGEVFEIAFAGSGSRYDGRKPYPHPHIVCLECGRIIDPKLNSLRDMTREVTDGSGFEILTYRLDFFGRCPACCKSKPAVLKKARSIKRRKI